ncbi:hypothetical protein AB0A70_22070 [Streptomyces morookaense]|uniref:hypothetical protein n=1 Tax=Streptomyces morookaense TaxID=1970 RepID=UPI0033EF2069
MLNALESVVPDLGRQRPKAARDVDWEVIRQLLGVGLPSDYKELAGSYPAFGVDDFLCVHIPRIGGEESFCNGIREDLEMLTDLVDADMAHGYVAHPGPNGLVPCASSLSGDVFYWRVSGPDPDRWPIVVSGRDDDWWEFPGGLVAFLTAWLGGTMERHGLPRNVPSPEPRVRLFRD